MHNLFAEFVLQLLILWTVAVQHVSIIKAYLVPHYGHLSTKYKIYTMLMRIYWNTLNFLIHFKVTVLLMKFWSLIFILSHTYYLYTYDKTWSTIPFDFQQVSKINMKSNCFKFQGIHIRLMNNPIKMFGFITFEIRWLNIYLIVVSFSPLQHNS